MQERNVEYDESTVIVLSKAIQPMNAHIGQG